MNPSQDPPAYAPSSRPAPRVQHSNPVIVAGNLRARDEQQMQQALLNLQYDYKIYNSDVEPEHESDWPCSCAIHRYKQMKYNRTGIQERWSQAVMYPGEKSYNDNPYGPAISFRNPYQNSMVPLYSYSQKMMSYGAMRPYPRNHAVWMTQMIALNNALNREAQAKIDSKEPRQNIWEYKQDTSALADEMGNVSLGDEKDKLRAQFAQADNKNESEKERIKKYYADQEKQAKGSSSKNGGQAAAAESSSKRFSLRKAFGIKSTEEKFDQFASKLQNDILYEENGRWPDKEWQDLVMSYQEKVGMRAKIAHLRYNQPLQYLHLLRAGYFEPIPVAWATQASNPMKFSIDAPAGWRGITPSWRGYEDLAEERLYWVLNHREGSVGTRMKPDFISEMKMANERMSRAVEPPPMYTSAEDTCHLQHTSAGYSKQVLPSPFRPFDRPEKPSDDTMILLDVSGSMDFKPIRPVYDQYLVTGFAPSVQPKNKDVAKAIVRRFTDAMSNHDHLKEGYDLVTFSDKSDHIGKINHRNFDMMWQLVKCGGGTRVMTGWQRVKELHFQKHVASATHHPVYGWQAGPETPMLRLLLLLDGEATDMDEFELDLLGLSWAHVTIFLIGVDGCPHHHRHANELQRISDVNHHVSFVDAQGNFPERYVTHELLKRHLGYDVSMQEFQEMEELPAYSEV